MSTCPGHSRSVAIFGCRGAWHELFPAHRERKVAEFFLYRFVVGRVRRVRDFSFLGDSNWIIYRVLIPTSWMSERLEERIDTDVKYGEKQIFTQQSPIRWVDLPAKRSFPDGRTSTPASRLEAGREKSISTEKLLNIFAFFNWKARKRFEACFPNFHAFWWGWHQPQ